MKGKVLDCGHRAEDRNGKATDFAIYEEKTVCLDCAVILAKAQMVTDTEMIGYLSCSGHAITTWAGDVLVDITEMWRMRHNWNPWYMIHWRGRDSEGRIWYGKAVDRSMATIMHRAKVK